MRHGDGLFCSADCETLAPGARDVGVNAGLVRQRQRGWGGSQELEITTAVGLATRVSEQAPVRMALLGGGALTGGDKSSVLRS